MRGTILALWAVVAGLPAWGASSEYGILLLAHGGDPNWNREVLRLRDQLAPEVPTEAAFGMFIDQVQVREIQNTLNRLERRQVKKVVVVPLFVNSESEVMDQIRYVLGVAESPSRTLRERIAATAARGQTPAPTFHSHFGSAAADRVRTNLPLVLTPALDDHPVMDEILLERARALSHQPQRETVFLVGHGAVEEDKDRRWLETLGRVAGRVQQRGAFKAVQPATLRDDSPEEVRAKAVRSLREKVQRARRDGGRALVVPVLIARGGIEPKISKALDGLIFAWDGRTLMPHPAIRRWVLEMAAWGAGQEDMRKYK